MSPSSGTAGREDQVKDQGPLHDEGVPLKGQQQVHGQRRCVCYREVGRRLCFGLRYRRDYIFGEYSDEECECLCHDEEDEEMDDFYTEQLFDER
jgi:hypothetical protein